LILGIIIFFSVGKANAQTGVTLYENVNYGGSSITLTSNVSDLRNVQGQNWNDRASSIKVSLGYTAIVYEDINYQGKSYIFTGDFSDFTKIGWNDKISSIRITTEKPPPGVYLYDDKGYAGGEILLTSDAPDLRNVKGWKNESDTNWNDRVSSIKISPGCTAVIYDDVNYKGGSYVITSDISDLTTIGWNDRFSSIKIVTGAPVTAGEGGRTSAPDCSTYCSNPKLYNPPPNQICICNPLKAPDLETLVNNIINFLFYIAIALTPLMVVIGAFNILTSGGDPKKVATGKNIIVYSLLAFAIISLAKGMVAMIKNILEVK